eukprot:5316373-Prymnesium_polylepis.1
MPPLGTRRTSAKLQGKFPQAVAPQECTKLLGGPPPPRARHPAASQELRMRSLAVCDSAVRVIGVGLRPLVSTAHPVSAPTPTGQPGAQCLSAEALQ